MTNGVRIIQFQTASFLQMFSETELSDEGIAHLRDIQNDMKRAAEAELARAYADGYAIVDTTIGGNAHVLLTVYTLHHHDSDPLKGLPMEFVAYGE
jgi:hypothetical protein